MRDFQRDSTPLPEPPLLERARLALQSLQFEEQAARYRAACAELMEAIADAEAGDEQPLKRWLDARRFLDDPAPTEAKLSSEHFESPWPRMERAARERAASTRTEVPIAESDAYGDRDRVGDHDTDEQVEPVAASAPVQEPIAHPRASLDLVSQAVGNQTPRAPTVRRRWFPPHVVGSLIAHGLILVVLAWWVVAVAQPDKQLSITSSPLEVDDVALETVVDSSPLESENSSEPEPAPKMDVADLPVEIPQISGVEGVTGPRMADSSVASSVGSLSEAQGLGTNLAAGAEFFGARAAGNNFVFVVDCSPSMARDGAFEFAKNEILRSLAMLQPKQRFSILFFGKEIVPIQFPGREPEAYMLPASPENLDKTVQWIRRASIQKEGRHPADAVRQALSMQPDGIFLLFDGDTKVETWIEMIKDSNRTDEWFGTAEVNVPIHVVHFFRDEFSATMKQLAEENHGTYRFIPKPSKGSLR
jgi:hypothetical protein